MVISVQCNVQVFGFQRSLSQSLLQWDPFLARARLTRSRRKRRLHSVSAATVAPQVGMVVAPVHPKPALNDAVAPFRTENAGVRCLRCKKIYFDKSGYNRHLSTHTECSKSKSFEYVLRACAPVK